MPDPVYPSSVPEPGPDARLVGKVAIVSGASSGIGKATSQELARLGARVVLVARGRNKLDAAVAEIEAAGGQACAVDADVTKPEDHQRAVDLALDRYGRLDYAVNNAGMPGRRPFLEATPDEFAKVLATNVSGVFCAMQAQIPAMLKGGGGAIVNTSSVGGLVGVPNLSMYTASKAAVIGLTKSVALEYATKGVRINCVAPGSTDTGMLASGTQEQRDALTQLAPMKRISDPIEQARAILYLLVDATYSTGIVLATDGGQSVP